MSSLINIKDEDYKKFQAALMLSGDDEQTVLSGMIKEYAHTIFAKAMGKEEVDRTENTEQVTVPTNEKLSVSEQKAQFVSWFRNLTRNGKPYNPVTISGYTGRIENACYDPIFSNISVKNLFFITDLTEFIDIQKQIKRCPGYIEFDARSHNGFTAALRKYEEFLRFQANGGEVSMTAIPPQYSRSSNVHRWTVEEDLVCCKRFLECYVVHQSNMDITEFLQRLAKEVPDVSEGSLRMKIQNIKYLTIRAGLNDSSTIKWLSQYSLQCEKAFQMALREMRI